MVFDVEGEIYKVGVSSKGNKYISILVKTRDGQKESLTIFYTGNNSYKPNTPYKGRVNAYVRMCSEVV